MPSSSSRPRPVAEVSPQDLSRLEWARRTVAAMTVRERIAQLHQHSPGVARLGIAPFVTGTEALHGVAWRGPATQFPQPVGMAASWDPELLSEVGAAIASEVRALHAADPRTSLDVWAPVVNPLRHPLWGRTEEGYSEDPLLNAELACGFSGGLRGEGDTWTTLPTLKHFLAYSNETDRDATSSDLSPRVLHEYELPGHLEPLVRGLAASVMLSYNLVNGRPAHLTDLLESQLRSRLPDPDLLFVVSDAGAPSNLFRTQGVVPGAPEAYAAMLRAGVDSFTDNDADPTETVAALTDALEQGLIEESHLDRAVVRQLVARARTGEFDDSPAPSAPVDRVAAHALAREVATRSAVLLARRDPQALPLRPGRTAVLGERAHTVLRDWYSGDFHDATPLADALRGRSEGHDVVTSRALDRISLSAPLPPAPGGVCPDAVSADPVLLAADSSLRCKRPAADGPAPLSHEAARLEVLELDDDVIALRETSTQRLVAPDERGRLAACADRIGGWVAQETFRRTREPGGTWRLQHLGSGRSVGVEHRSGALVLRDHRPGSAVPFTVAEHHSGREAFDAAARGAETVVLVLGNDPHVHGRETEDRPDVRLPAPARAAAERLAALPDDVATVLVLISSYPYDLEGLEDRVGAVVWSSHAGEAEGTALADLLTGRRSFSGRLAQTWPGSAPLPSVLDYDVITTSSTYLYGQEARFAFGHGLAIDRPRWERSEVTATADGLQVEVTLSPPPSRHTAGPLHEIVQVYADVPVDSFSRRRYAAPRTRLVGFATSEVAEQGTTTVRLLVPFDRLALFAPDREGWELPDGPVTIRVARSSTDAVSSHEVRVPAVVREEAPVPLARPGRVPAERAEETSGLARGALTLLAGTDLRPTGTAPGWADFVLDAGTVVTSLESRPLGAEDEPASRVELIDPAAADPATTPSLSLPHTVPSERGRPTGRVRARLVGPLAMTGLVTQQR